jgi:2-oxoisovalerate dehydrogenase E1 component alpha subunit
VPEERQSRIPLFRRAHGFGFPGVRVDGNDVLACLAVTRKALRHAREGSGPFLIEAFTYRMGAHTTSDDPTRYRLQSELETWKLRDPIERVKAFLSRNGHADSSFFEAIDSEAEELAARVRKACLSMPEPKPLDLFDKVYAGGSPLIDEERAAYEHYLAGYAPEGGR